jgi:hypothetical protein
MIKGEFPGDIFLEVTLLFLALGTLIQLLSFALDNFFLVRKSNR